MKEYHTTIIINSSISKVWNELTNFDDYPKWNPLVGKLEGDIKEGNQIATYIVPLKNTYQPVIISYKINEELVWLGIQGAKFLMAGKHYYMLRSISTTQTELLHGEYFTGLLSYALPSSMLKRMKTAFELHNSILKKRVEERE